MTSPDDHTQDGAAEKRQATATLEEVLSIIGQQHHEELDQWECFHFWRGLRALRAGNYDGVGIEAEYALTPPDRRSPAALAKVEAGPAIDRCSVAILRRELPLSG